MIPKAPIPFRGFSDGEDVRIYEHGILPHWRQVGCTYFVTFRLADSIPKPVLIEIERDRTAWLEARGIDPHDINWKYRFAKLPPSDRKSYEKLVGRLINKSLDACHGSCMLRNPTIGNMVAAALNHFHGSRILTGDFVVMPNHVHVLMTPIDGFELEDVLCSMKSYTAHQCNRLLSRTGAFWQRQSYDHIVRNTKQLQAYQNYIASNPTKANLNTGHYVLSQAQYHELA